MTVTQHQLDAILPTALSGTVVETLGVTAAVADFPAPLGAIVEIEKISGEPVEAEVIAFRDGLTIVYPFGEISGVRHGSQVVLRQTTRTLRVGDALLGRVVDAHARCVDGRHPPLLEGRVRLERRPPRHTERPTINQPLSTGIRAIPTLCLLSEEYMPIVTTPTCLPSLISGAPSCAGSEPSSLTP